MYHSQCKPAPAAAGPAKAFFTAERPSRGKRGFSNRGRWKTLAVIPALLLIVYGMISGTNAVTQRSRPEVLPHASPSKPRPAARPLGKPEVQTITGGVNFLNLRDNRVEVRRGNACYSLQTSLDPDLQQFLVRTVQRRVRLVLRGIRRCGIKRRSAVGV